MGCPWVEVWGVMGDEALKKLVVLQPCVQMIAADPWMLIPLFQYQRLIADLAVSIGAGRRLEPAVGTIRIKHDERAEGGHESIVGDEAVAEPQGRLGTCAWPRPRRRSGR